MSIKKLAEKVRGLRTRLETLAACGGKKKKKVVAEMAWDESKHKRGKTSKKSRGGSFAPTTAHGLVAGIKRDFGITGDRIPPAPDASKKARMFLKTVNQELKELGYVYSKHPLGSRTEHRWTKGRDSIGIATYGASRPELHGVMFNFFEQQGEAPRTYAAPQGHPFYGNQWQRMSDALSNKAYRTGKVTDHKAAIEAIQMTVKKAEAALDSAAVRAGREKIIDHWTAISKATAKRTPVLPIPGKATPPSGAVISERLGKVIGSGQVAMMGQRRKAKKGE